MQSRQAPALSLTAPELAGIAPALSGPRTPSGCPAEISRLVGHGWQFICGVLAVAVDWRSEYKPQRPIEEIHNDLDWAMWQDRVRRGDVGALG